VGIVRMGEMPMTARRDLFDPTCPAHLHPEQRQREVAAIFATGVIRLRAKRRAAPQIARARGSRAVTEPAASSSHPGTGAASLPQIPPDSGETRLELSRRSSPDGQCG
jgi:hypothetical protein